MLASASGQVSLVKALLAQHARTDAEDHDRRTALWYAAASGSRDEVDCAACRRRNQEAADVLGLTVLHAAAAQTETAVLEPLLAPEHVSTRAASAATRRC